MSDPEDEEPLREAVPRALLPILLKETSIHRRYCEKRIRYEGFGDVVPGIARRAAAKPDEYTAIANNPGRLMATIETGTDWFAMRHKRSVIRRDTHVRGRLTAALDSR
jgi:hypothetical protein